MRSLALPLALSILLAGCASSSRDAGETAPDGTMTDTAALEPEAFVLLPILEDGPFRLRATVSSDVPIDAWLLEGDACRAIFSLPQHDPTDALQAQVAGVLERDVSVSNACVVLDNSRDEHGGAAPTGHARVNYTIEVWR